MGSIEAVRRAPRRARLLPRPQEADRHLEERCVPIGPGIFTTSRSGLSVTSDGDLYPAGARQPHREGSALSDGAVDGDLAVVSVDDAADDGEPQSGAAGAG